MTAMLVLTLSSAGEARPLRTTGQLWRKRRDTVHSRTVRTSISTRLRRACGWWKNDQS